jgi:hypothetical protein
VTVEGIPNFTPIKISKKVWFWLLAIFGFLVLLGLIGMIISW